MTGHQPWTQRRQKSPPCISTSKQDFPLCKGENKRYHSIALQSKLVPFPLTGPEGPIERHSTRQRAFKTWYFIVEQPETQGNNFQLAVG